MSSSISDVENVPEFLSFDHVTDGMRPANGAKGLLENWPMRIRLVCVKRRALRQK